MPLTRRYCSECGADVVVQDVMGRPRTVCPACGTIFYSNPLPVAASIVLNANREVLLVRRKQDPYRGEWCLPMGFAEVGETIADAASRELAEETGIEARVYCLIDVDSFESKTYGDLLIVTFELEKTGGEERPGDDAEDVRYFPLDQRPALPFDSNEKALQMCAQLHVEGWAIRDSFAGLDAPVSGVLLSDPLIETIERGAGEIVASWLDDLLASTTTASARSSPPERLGALAKSDIGRLCRWLAGDDGGPAMKQAFFRSGQSWRQRGTALDEIVSAQSLLKKHVWRHVRSHAPRSTPIEVYRILELSQRIALFFDKAIYHTTRGFAKR